MKNTKIVKLDDREVEVKKLPIGGYSDLIKAIKRLPKHLVKFENLDRNKIVAILPDVAADSLPDLVGLIAVAVDMQKDEVNALGLHEVIALIEAFFDVNQYDKVAESVKKVLAHPAIKQYSEKAIENQKAEMTSSINS